MTSSQLVSECSFLWKIKNFSVCTKQNRQYIRSPIFVSKVVDDIAWRLLICLHGEHCEEDHIALNLARVFGDVEGNFQQEIFFEVGLVNVYGRTSCDQESTLDMRSFINLTLPKFVESSEVLGAGSQLLLRDVLTVKGRLWKHSPLRVSSEKLLLRSTLCMEEVKERIIFNPQEFFQSFKINSQAVPEGYALNILRCEIDRGAASFEIAPPSISIEPLDLNNDHWTFITAKMDLIGRLYTPVSHMEGHAHFGMHFERPWLLPPFKGPFDIFCYYHSYKMDLDCEFTISNLEKESVWETTYSGVWNRVVEAENDRLRHVLANDMRPLLQDPMFSDVLVQVGEVTIPAHRVVLCARSVIFRHLFTHDTEKDRESSWIKVIEYFNRLFRRHTEEPKGEPLLSVVVRESGVSLSKVDGRLSIVFSDVEEDIVRKMVTYMYTDDLGWVDHDTVVKLLYAGRRYGIPGLIRYCLSLLRNTATITVENAARTLSTSHFFRNYDLKRKALWFINEHLNCVLLQLDSLSSDDEDKKNAKYLGLVRGEYRNTNWFPRRALRNNLNDVSSVISID